MGLLLSIYRDSQFGDCTNSGISSPQRGARGLCVVNASGPFDPSDDYPAVLLDHHHRGIVRIVPAQRNERGGWSIAPGHFMMGGNFASTSDSRFREQIENMIGHQFYGAVAIHDRQER